MAEPRPLDRALLRERPLPTMADDVDKNTRGRVLVLGGCASVPGGVALTAEAALRAGAGKVRIGTIAPAAMMLGALVPEAAVLALPEGARGEIVATPALLAAHLVATDAVVVGPAMSCAEHGGRLAGQIAAQLDRGVALVLDAAALLALDGHAGLLRDRPMPALLTPHLGEMAALLDRPAEAVAQDRAGAVREAATRFGAVVALKGATTLVADPHGALFAYPGGGAGLATGGSGDVLAGIAGALLARGAAPLDAALWAVWLHGDAGRRCAATIGPLGFLARELLGMVPRALADASA